MAAPAIVTTKNMSGKFLMNKTLSDDTDEILRLQGISWFMRRAIATFTLTLYIKHTTDEAGIEHIDIDQKLSGGIPGDSENRILDWTERKEDDKVFGFITGRSRRIPVAELPDEYLKEGWTEDTINDDIVLTDSWGTPGKNKYEWKALQTWGFSMVNGERRYVRHTTFTSPSKEDGPIHARFVYDYLGPV